ncbi:MAG: AAA family ATPase [Rudaea sp.]|uniref:chloramphenicol phosphotransferase CPT family protein n=1 Tax=Rudaea sp. TaxID=2136325 RepID=UPI0039E40A95
MEQKMISESAEILHIDKHSTFGCIVLINGTSSAGKTTLAKALQKHLDEPFCYYASDQLAEQGFRPLVDFTAGSSERERFFDGFHRSIAAFAMAGNNLIVEHIVEKQSWADELAQLLSPFDVFWVGVHAHLKELKRRERDRKNRSIGEARYHLATHKYCNYDIEVDSTLPLAANLKLIVDSWRRRISKSGERG